MRWRRRGRSERGKYTPKKNRKRIVNKNKPGPSGCEQKQFKVSNSGACIPFCQQKRVSCNEIDINILFISNTKCTHPIGHSAEGEGWLADGRRP
jgi:hypothetical protein